MHPQEAFIKEATKNISDKDFRNKITGMLDANERKRRDAISDFSNLELAKQRAAYIKWKVTENLDKYLVDFESAIIRKGGKVIWAYDGDNALNEIDQIIARTKAKKIIKSKTGIGAEIGLKNHLRAKGHSIFETDFGDYIMDAMGEKSFHLALPTIHKSKSDVNKLLNAKIKSSLEADENELVSDIRAELRNKFFDADIGITGANFLIADTGLVAISEEEGNARLSFTFAKTHIVLASIDKILPTINDLDLFFTLFASHSTGKQLMAYNTITGPRNRDDYDSPGEFIVILLDNGRSNVLAAQDQRQALSCIKCGACSNVCPVFKNIGGQTAYQSFNSGPIGQVIGTLQQGLEEYKYLSNASTICGKCTEVCPVKIDIHNHLLRNRHDCFTQGLDKTGDKIAWYTWKKFMLSRKNLNRPTSIKSFTFKQLYKNDWGEKREFPKMADKSFNQLWREKMGDQ